MFYDFTYNPLFLPFIGVVILVVMIFIFHYQDPSFEKEWEEEQKERSRVYNAEEAKRAIAIAEKEPRTYIPLTNIDLSGKEISL